MKLTRYDQHAHVFRCDAGVPWVIPHAVSQAECWPATLTASWEVIATAKAMGLPLPPLDPSEVVVSRGWDSNGGPNMVTLASGRRWECDGSEAWRMAWDSRRAQKDAEAPREDEIALTQEEIEAAANADGHPNKAVGETAVKIVRLALTRGVALRCAAAIRKHLKIAHDRPVKLRVLEQSPAQVSPAIAGEAVEVHDYAREDVLCITRAQAVKADAQAAAVAGWAPSLFMACREVASSLGRRSALPYAFALRKHFNIEHERPVRVEIVDEDVVVHKTAAVGASVDARAVAALDFFKKGMGEVPPARLVPVGRDEVNATRLPCRACGAPAVFSGVATSARIGNTTDSFVCTSPKCGFVDNFTRSWCGACDTPLESVYSPRKGTHRGCPRCEAWEVEL